VVNMITGGVGLLLPFVAFFCTGILFLLYGGRIPYRPLFAAGAAAALCGCLFVPDLARAGAAVFGGYLVFWFALAVRSPLIDRLRPRQDISYGLYLYGWPVQSLIIFWFRDLSAFQVSLLTLVVAGLFGWLSWVLVESPALRLKRTGLARHGLARKS
jgi:peptidoglycan/LPS O-acetylase OafA/YrhL